MAALEEEETPYTESKEAASAQLELDQAETTRLKDLVIAAANKYIGEPTEELDPEAFDDVLNLAYDTDGDGTKDAYEALDVPYQEALAATVAAKAIADADKEDWDTKLATTTALKVILDAAIALRDPDDEAGKPAYEKKVKDEALVADTTDLDTKAENWRTQAATTVTTFKGWNADPETFSVTNNANCESP